tara:strand:- start:208 stop:438 length:231 start_codon:yes stop_codon:yes gene_type:complete
MTKNKRILVLSIIEKICNLKKNNISPAKKISGIKGWDSLNNLRIFVEIEKNLKIKVKPNQVQKIRTVNDIFKILKI